MKNKIYDLLKNKEKTERPGREIKLLYDQTKNRNITVKTGTVDDKNCPDTVFISISFWVDVKNRDLSLDESGMSLSRDFIKEVNKIYRQDLREKLYSNKYFPYFNENIFICNAPRNIAYNDKKSFVNIELNLHTINIRSEKKYSLKNSHDNKLFNELTEIAKIISNTNLLKGKCNFSIHKKKSS